MKTFDYDLRYFNVGVEQLENYLLSNDAFWPVDIRPPSGDPGYPQLTLGGLLLARTRLNAYSKTPKQVEQLEKLTANMDTIRAHWRVAWEKKAAHDFSIRLRMWRDYLDEYLREPQDNADRFPYEARLRTMLTLLNSQGVTIVQAELDLLELLDTRLESAFIPGDFIWEAELQPGFPENTFWYLYGRLPAMPLRD